MNPRLAALALLVGATTLLAACGLPQGATPQRGAASVSHQAGAPGQPAPALKPAAANAGTARAAAASAAGPAQVSQSNAGSEVPPLPPITRMVVKNGTLSIMVENPEASLS
ncbi:MAG: hypothetical protein KGJ86_22255, partial [Chloroflexota bacterium]|nr:hypothetical protein [Chloroflexota bacterium]